jgi:hypothetical protein
MICTNISPEVNTFDEFLGTWMPILKEEREE